MRTVADYMVAGMNLPPLDIELEDVSSGARCAITGVEIMRGYPTWKVIPPTVGDFSDLFPNGIGLHISESAGRAFKGSWNMGSWIFFEDGVGYHPLINQVEARAQSRKSWSEIVREIKRERIGENAVIILTTDPKKRLWHRARIGTIGEATPVYIHDGKMNISQSCAINWPDMVSALDLVELIYGQGFSKRAIANSLPSEWKTTEKVGVAETLRLERQVLSIRNTDDFVMALLIAQREN